MKLSAREVAGYCARPDPEAAGLLLYGGDPMRVAHRRQQAVAALIGPQGEAEMRLARIAGADLRRDPAALMDAVKAQSFFPGPRVALVEEAGDSQAETIAAALGDWRPGDAQIVVTAGQLKPASKLRKLFEGHRSARAAAIYDDPPGREEIQAELARAGLAGASGPALDALFALGRTLEPGDFRQTLEKLALYKLDDETPLSAEEVGLLAPASTEAEADDVVHAAAEAREGEIGPLMQRLSAQGVTPVRLSIAAGRHFRQLYRAASDPEGPGKGIARLRPPVWGPRRDRMEKQARDWGAARLQTALQLLADTDRALRSANQTAPQMAVMERTLLRLSRLRGRR
ncbi:DNA polymerase III subunit delta [Rhodosalinus halophilus]|uniref:DNA-directed DNA polymerase n=1 Tax=Rhodosalinus halophilus TaxID=2259333 RepID=A0A365UAT1_9RHOB|nr:DNA polymerase III subunit delta [Rhodosalinus halophilus]RBI86259.1 DNA polymerase III subunit delta [Rhodosalinus halophilus]